MNPDILRHYCREKRSSESLNIWKYIWVGMKMKIFIQDIPENRYNDVVDYMMSDFIKDEGLFSGFGVNENPQALKEIQMLWKEILKCGWSIAAFVDNPKRGGKPIVIGANILYVSTIETRIGTRIIHRSFRTKNIAGIIKILELLTRLSNIHILYGSEKYLTALGFSVNPLFDDIELGRHILAARELLCRRYGLSSSGSVFTSDTAIRLAEREGYDCLVRRRPSRIKFDKSVFSIENCNCEKIVFMGKKF